MTQPAIIDPQPVANGEFACTVADVAAARQVTEHVVRHWLLVGAITGQLLGRWHISTGWRAELAAYSARTIAERSAAKAVRAERRRAEARNARVIVLAERAAS